MLLPCSTMFHYACAYVDAYLAHFTAFLVLSSVLARALHSEDQVSVLNYNCLTTIKTQPIYISKEHLWINLIVFDKRVLSPIQGPVLLKSQG